jgi:hypothetical protein
MTKPKPSIPDDQPEYGPHFAALNEKRRAFVLAVLADPHGRQGDWAAAAGYSTHKNGHAVVACNLLQDERIRAAIFEVARGHLQGAGPALAVKNLLRIAADTKNSRHYDASIAILNRTGLGEKAEHIVRVENVTDQRMMELAARLAGELGVDVGTLAGANLMPAPKLIEGEAVEVQPEKPEHDPGANTSPTSDRTLL